MKKYPILLLPCLLLATASYAAYDGNAPLFEDESWRWVNMNLIIFVGGFLLFLYIVRRLYEFRLRMSDQKNAAANAARNSNVYIPRYWFQCKNCGLTIRKETAPKNTECSHAVSHLWTDLGEIGTSKYLCKSCNTLINTKKMPPVENCRQSELHNWELLS